MKFDRVVRWESATWTPRKLAMHMSKPARQAASQAAKYPLLADVLEAPPPARDPAAELRARQARMTSAESSMRNLHASQWRNARAKYRACTQEQRDEIDAKWATWTGPRNPVCFSYLVRVASGEYQAITDRMRQRDRELKAAIDAQRMAEAACKPQLFEDDSK
ncbi:hypothetical protein [Ideonella livida]|uniref:Uncharacterized protein n=1 Tax=Ideonella livida TaxID=2707176 RepID=A0A7C9PEM8_9BURK|nr:hypothetical protein [Ideonella livida]NDY89769.1 hypothetical protein [Ideonella livida]